MSQDSQSFREVEGYLEELDQLTADVATMGGLVERALHDALTSIKTRDSDLSYATVMRDRDIDTLHRDIETQIIAILALRQPVSQQLRVCISALKIVTDLERVGDLSKSIARRAPTLNTNDTSVLIGSITRMGQRVQSHLNQVLNAYTTGEIRQAVGVWERDDDIDEHYYSLFRELLTAMTTNPKIRGSS